MVWYKRQLEDPIDDYLQEFECYNLLEYDDSRRASRNCRIIWPRMIERTARQTPDDRMLYLELWRGKPLTPDELKFECETYYS